MSAKQLEITQIGYKAICRKTKPITYSMKWGCVVRDWYNIATHYLELVIILYYTRSSKMFQPMRDYLPLFLF